MRELIGAGKIGWASYWCWSWGWGWGWYRTAREAAACFESYFTAIGSTWPEIDVCFALEEVSLLLSMKRCKKATNIVTCLTFPERSASIVCNCPIASYTEACSRCSAFIALELGGRRYSIYQYGTLQVEEDEIGVRVKMQPRPLASVIELSAMQYSAAASGPLTRF